MLSCARQEIKKGEYVKVIQPVFECDGGQRCAVLYLVEGRDAKGWVWLKDPADKGGKVKLKESREQKLEPQRASTGTQVADHGSFTLWDHPTGSDMYLHVNHNLILG